MMWIPGVGFKKQTVFRVGKLALSLPLPFVYKERVTMSSLWNFLFIVPALLLFLVFGVYPFYKVFQLSLMEWEGLKGLPMTFVGFRNFWEIFTSDKMWWISMLHAGWITFLALTLQNGVALILALMCARDIRGGHVYRVIFYIPPVLSGIVIGLVWSLIYSYPDGVLNTILTRLGLESWTRPWLGDPKTALNAVAFVHMWKGFGWGFVILLAGLQNIPQQIYEAAKVDGANAWQRFIYITVPMMIPVFVLVAILTILGTMQIYDIIAATTNGGPTGHTEVPVTQILSWMNRRRFGYASAEGVVFGLILLLSARILFMVSKRLRQD